MQAANNGESYKKKERKGKERKGGYENWKLSERESKDWMNFFLEAF